MAAIGNESFIVQGLMGFFEQLPALSEKLSQGFCLFLERVGGFEGATNDVAFGSIVPSGKEG